MLSTVLGVTAATWGVLMALSPLLQIREIRRRRTSAGVSVAYLLVLLVGFVLWLAYGAASSNVPLVVPNIVAVLVMALTIGVARRYR